MGLFARLFHPLKSANLSDPALEQALERAALGLAPGIRQSRHWPGRYKSAVGAALSQARRVAQGVPGPVLLDRDSWVRDPFVHALFASAEAMQRAISMSPALRDFVASQGGEEVYALLSLQREEKQAFGMESSGAVLRREVAQQIVWFSDPQFSGAAVNETEAREKLLWAIFDRFLDRLAVGIKQIRVERERLAQKKDHAQTRLRGAEPTQRPDLEREFGDALKHLGEIGANLDPERLHEVFGAILAHPEDCIYLEQRTFSLDAMGVVRNGEHAAAATTLRFTDLLERYQSPRTLVLVRCHNVTSSTTTDRLGEAEQWL